MSINEPGPAAFTAAPHPAQVPNAGAPAQPAGPSGSRAWAMGLLALTPIPFIGQLVAGIVQMVVGLRQRSTGGAVGANGANAADWGLTYAIGWVLIIAWLPIGIALFQPQPGEDPPAGLVGPFAGGILVLNLLHLIFTIRGMVVAGRGQVARAWAIPAFRATGSSDSRSN